MLPCYGVEHSGAAAMHLHTARSFAFSATASSPIQDRLARGLVVGCPIALGAPMTTASRMQIIRAGNPDLLPALEIPRSTAMSWIRRGPPEVVSFDSDNDGKPALRDRLAKLERRIAMLTAVLRLVLAPLRVSGFKLELSRVPDAAGKRRLLGAIEHARRSMPLSLRSELSDFRRPDTTPGPEARGSARSTIDPVVRDSWCSNIGGCSCTSSTTSRQ
jgi:hypothetical protein